MKTIYKILIAFLAITMMVSVVSAFEFQRDFGIESPDLVLDGHSHEDVVMDFKFHNDPALVVEETLKDEAVPKHTDDEGIRLILESTPHSAILTPGEMELETTVLTASLD